jgi:hypothetical protein
MVKRVGNKYFNFNYVYFMCVNIYYILYIGNGVLYMHEYVQCTYVGIYVLKTLQLLFVPYTRVEEGESMTIIKSQPRYEGLD